MKSEPQNGEPWTIETINSQIGNTGDYEGIALLRTNCGRIIAQQQVEDEDDPYMTRIRDTANLLAGHDLSSITIVDNAVLEEVKAALTNIISVGMEYYDMEMGPNGANAIAQAEEALSKLNTATP